MENSVYQDGDKLSMISCTSFPRNDDNNSEAYVKNKF